VAPLLDEGEDGTLLLASGPETAAKDPTPSASRAPRAVLVASPLAERLR
jgi:hypothetical protein